MSNHHTSSPSLYASTLFVVATPIGNLADLSPRAAEILSAVDVIYAEDTRQTQKLLTHLGVKKRLIALHKHNEAKQKNIIAEQLQLGHSIALVSDAGTPLIADPGYVVVEHLHAKGLSVRTIPGCSSVIAALSVSGLPSDHFEFAGFVPAKPTQRQAYFQRYRYAKMTTVFFETPHRIVACLQDCVTVFGDTRQMFLGRELTKQFETTKRLPLGELLDFVQSDANQQRGEFVLILAPSEETEPEAWQTLANTLVEEGVSTKTAAKIVSELTNVGKKQAYQYLIERD